MKYRNRQRLLMFLDLETYEIPAEDASAPKGRAIIESLIDQHYISNSLAEI